MSATATAPNSTPAADFALEDLGARLFLRPLSPAAHDWCSACLPDDVRWLNCSAVIDPRLADAILDGIAQSGLHVGPFWRH